MQKIFNEFQKNQLTFMDICKKKTRAKPEEDATMLNACHLLLMLNVDVNW